MEANEFDRNAGSKLSRHESQLDIDAFWNQLEPKLPKDRSRPVFLILFLLLGLFACFALWKWKFNQNLIAKNENIILADQSRNNSIPESVCDSIISNRALINNNKAQENSAHNKLVSGSGKKIENPLKSKESAKVDLYANDLHKTSMEESLISVVKNKNLNARSSKGDKARRSGNDKGKGKGNGNGILPGDVSQLGLNSKKDQEINLYSKQESKSHINFLEEPQKPDVESSLNSDTVVETDLNTSSVYNNELKLISNLPVRLNPVTFQHKERMPKNEQIPEIEKTTLKITDPVKFQFSIMPLGGLGFYTKHLYDSGNDAYKNYVSIRNFAESNLEEWFLSLNVKMTYGKAGLLSGIEYVRRNERFSALSMKEEHHFGTTEIRIEEGDSIHYISGSGWYGVSQLHKVVHYNSVQQWNIPLGLNYSVALHRLKLECSAGVVFSISNKITGKTFDSSLQISEWGQSNDLVYHTQLGIGWFGDLSCTIPMTTRLGFNAGIRIQEFPEDYLNGPLTLHYRSYLIRSGIVLWLF